MLKNFGQMMKQMQEMQDKMAKMQEELETETIEGSAGGGMVTAVVDGQGNFKKFTIDPSLLKEEEKEMLEDLLVAVCTDLKKKADQKRSSAMEKITGGISLPTGFKLPF
jgi:hypothetical protein